MRSRANFSGRYDIFVSASSDKFDNGTEGGPNANKKHRKREKWSNQKNSGRIELKNAEYLKASNEKCR